MRSLLRLPSTRSAPVSMLRCLTSRPTSSSRRTPPVSTVPSIVPSRTPDGFGSDLQTARLELAALDVTSCRQARPAHVLDVDGALVVLGRHELETPRFLDHPATRSDACWPSPAPASRRAGRERLG